jgi:hypothetical protein
MSLIYVAGKWSRRGEVKAVMAQLRDLGHVITHDWTDEDELPGASQAAKDAHFARCALADMAGVVNADWFILLHDPTCRGAFVELGAALAHGVRVVVVNGQAGGADPALSCPIFYWMPEVTHVQTVEQALALVGGPR